MANIRTLIALIFIIFASNNFCQVNENVQNTGNNANELFKACEKGDYIRVKKLIKLGVNIDSKNEHGETPLFKTAEAGRLDIVRLLVQEGADINEGDDVGTSALGAAAFFGRKETCQYLIQEGADIENQDANNGITPLMWACGEGHWKVCKLLLDYGANPNAKAYDSGWTVLHEAVVAHISEKNKRKICNLLIDKGAEVDAMDDTGTTLLFEAVYGGELTVCKSLINRNADVNYRREKDGNVVLMEAALRGYLKVCSLLIKAGADIKAKNNQGKTALHYAAEYGRTDVCRLLLEQGAELNSIDNQGKNPTDLAVEEGHTETANYLKVQLKK